VRLLALPWWALWLAGVVACAPAPPTLDAVVAANLSARGGEARIRALRSLRASGVATASGGRVARIVREIERPGRLRVEFTSQGVTAVYVHDGDTGWFVDPLAGQFEPAPLPPESAAATDDQLDLEGPLVGWREKGHEVLLLGRESLDGRPVDKLELRLRGGEVRYDYLDAETHLLVRSDAVRSVRGRRVELETTYSDYRDVGGLRFPFHVETRAKGRPDDLDIVVDSIEIDPELGDERFRRPE